MSRPALSRPRVARRPRSAASAPAFSGLLAALLALAAVGAGSAGAPELAAQALYGASPERLSPASPAGPPAASPAVPPAPWTRDPGALADALFAPWDHPDSPGCAVGLYRGGEVVMARGYGSANLDWGIPMDPTTVVYAGSVSKQFTAATAALLHLEGALGLDDDIRIHLPELPAWDPVVTVRQLVHHTSGVRDIYGLIALSGGSTADEWSDQDYLDLLARQVDLNFPAGSEYSYSNGAYFLLTTVIERVTGESLDEAARARIFDPLQMHDTHFHQDRERIVARRAMSYGGSRANGFRQTYLGNFDKAGAGGLYTTIEDLAAWNRNLETGEVGGEAFLALMHTPGVLTSGDTLSYAFGVQLGEADGRPTVGHGGTFMGFRADFVRYPEEGIAVASLCNLGTINPGELTRALALGVLGPVEPGVEGDATGGGDPAAPDAGAGAGSPGDAAPAAPPTAALATFAGSWRAPEVGATWEILRWPGGGLALFRGGPDTGQELEHVAGNRFRAGSQFLDFQVEGGRPVSFRLDAGRVKNLRFERVVGIDNHP